MAGKTTKKTNKTTETMTIHKALCELKVINARIDKALQNKFCGACAKSAKEINGKSIEEYRTEIRSNYDMLIDLVKRRDAIKRAVALSNNTTTVDIAGELYTIVEAIDMKNNTLSIKLSILDMLRHQYAQAMTACDSRNKLQDLETIAINYAKALCGETADPEVMNTMVNTYIDDHTVVLLDEINIAKVINDLTEECTEFTRDVDSALSVSNAITEITINY